MGTWQINVVAGFCFAMGAAAIVAPSWVVGFMSMRAATVDARSEVRAVYGGFGLALAVALVCGEGAPKDVRDGLHFGIATAFWGMAMGRGVSAVIDRQTRLWPVIFYFVELALGGLLLADNAFMPLHQLLPPPLQGYTFSP
jgi:peptidoglycan/LPS O-acetylase OafA/YrhL